MHTRLVSLFLLALSGAGSSEAQAAPLTSDSWAALSQTEQIRHVDKAWSHAYVRLGPPKRVEELLKGEHAVQRVCVVAFRMQVLLESKKFQSAGPSSTTYSIVQFTEDGMQAWTDRFHDQLVATHDARGRFDVRGLDALKDLESYTARGSEGTTKNRDSWKTGTGYWRVLADGSRLFLLPEDLIARQAYVQALSEESGCDLFVNASLLVTMEQGKKGTIDGVEGRWLEGTMGGSFHTYLPRNKAIAAAEAGGHFVPPKWAPRVNPYFALEPKKPTAFRIFLTDTEGAAADRVREQHWVAPFDTAFSTVAEGHVLALDLAYPDVPGAG